MKALEMRIRVTVLACVASGMMACTAGGESPVVAQPALTVTVNGGSFGVGDTVEVVVRNGLEQSVWVHDQMSWCSVVSIERWDGEDWVRIGECATTAPRLAVALEGGSDHRIPLVPGAEARGTCRASLVYSPDEGFFFASARMAVSATFTIE
jgi:hypothetical protein